MKTSLSPDGLEPLLSPLHSANKRFAAAFPGEPDSRQPVHTVYGGAHLFKADSAAKLGRLALRSLDEHAANFADFSRAIELEGAAELPKDEAEIAHLAADLDAAPERGKSFGQAAWLAHAVYRRVQDKLHREPVEDFRIDFEDGYGNRANEEEDACAVAAAEETARGMEAGSLPPFIGIRIKPLSQELHTRSLRTLDLFVSTLAAAHGGNLPQGFVVTLPKITVREQVSTLVEVFARLEAMNDLEPGSLRMELMVETPQSLFDDQGRASLPGLVAAAQGRCIGAHFGTYDYTASLSIAAEHQHMSHLSCDVARSLMQLTLAGSGIALSDGATNILPVAPHRPAANKGPLSADLMAENRRRVHGAWRLHFQHVRHSLENAFYQGWDLHPAQLPTRYAALYSFFLEGLEAASTRLAGFMGQAARATLAGDVFDDAATGQGLLNFFLRGMSCGAITEDEALRTGLTLDELRSRSFLAILEGRNRKT